LFTYSIGAGSSLLSHLTTAAVFMIGGYQVLQGSLTVGTLVAFTAYFTRTSNSAMSLMNLYLAYQRAAVSLQRVRELLVPTTAALAGVTPSSGTPAAVSIGSVPEAAEIRFEGLTYAPAGSALPVLNALNWTVAGGSKCVVYGDSGAGKSTLIDLLRRFAESSAGRIVLAGIPLHHYDLATLRRAVIVLETEPVLFRGSILHNLRYGNFNSCEDAVLRAARRAGVEEFATQLPTGFSTEIGAGGQGLSTGQRQRVAIARALLGVPSVLVLDEATSNLDAAAVAEMHALLDEHFSRCTRIVITHAPRQVPRADRVFYLESGRIVDVTAESARA
jgi:ATP-binding cassette subfamily B protein